MRKVKLIVHETYQGKRKSCLVDSSGIATRRNLVNTVFYEYAKDGSLKLKKTVPASGVQTIVEYNEKETVVTVGDIKYNVKSETDGLGRKEYDHIGLYDNVLSREFAYHQGKVTQEHKDNNKVLDAATTNLVKAITYSDGRVIEYEYDGEERITKVIDTKPDNLQTVTEYTYDNAGQLLNEKVNGNVINTMVYDLYGNIQSKNGKVYEYDSVWKDLLISYDGQPIVYDNQGNPTTYLGNALTFEKGRQLKTFGNVSFKYNANGIRTEKTVGDVLHTYTVDGSKILKESWSGRTIIPMYNEEEVIGIRYNGLAYYFIKNLQGDVISITDADGNVVAEYSYDAWGVPTVISDTSGKNISTYNPYRYRSYYYDREIGLYYLQSRYYDPRIGRFVNSDDAMFLGASGGIGSYNLFAYCENDAVNHSDYMGYWSVKRDSISFLIDVTISLVSFWAKYAYDIIGLGLKTIFKRYGKRFLLDTLSGAVPKIKSWAGKFLTIIRTVLWRIGFVALSYLVGKLNNYITYTVNWIQKYILKKNWLSSNDLNIIYCFFSTGGIIALFFDYMTDGCINGWIKIY